MKKFILLLGVSMAIAACAPSSTSKTPATVASESTSSASVTEKTIQAKPILASSDIQAGLNTGKFEQAVFAGGCFWCVESDFEKLEGVVDAVSGYTGGRTKNPSYKSVSYTETGHYEAVKVTFDPSVVNYSQLLDYFWHHIDVTDPNGQFCDKGSSYRTAVFADESQIAIAEQSKNDIAVSKPFDGPVVTEILPLGPFHIAEDYHQDYYKTNPVRYARYRIGCRRDARLKQLWGQSEFYGSGK